MTDLRSDGAAALEWAASYLERVGELPVLAQVKPGEIRAQLPQSPPDEPEPFSAVLRDLDEVLLPGVTHWQHPRFFAYFANTAAEPAILAELLTATLNSVAFLWRTAPAATELEAVVLDWTAQLLGLPSGWHGHIEDTASTSTLAAIIAARATTGRDLIVCSDQAHSAADKAAKMLDMRLRKVRSDDAFRLDLEALGDLSDAAVVVATVGTTATASVDPVPAIADACERDGAWLHVDAAYAGSAMVCPEHRWAFDGVDRADSLVVNAHKWMLTPVDCSLLWTRRPDDFRNAFSVVPEFLRTPSEEDSFSLSEYGPALGRRFRALKLWAVLRCYGRVGLQSYIRSGIELAERFERWVVDEPGWELCAPRRFSLVCFRLEGDDERNRKLLERVNASGEMFISQAVLNGRYVLQAGDRSVADDRGRRRAGVGRAATRGGRAVIPVPAVPIPSVPLPPPPAAYIGAPASAHPDSRRSPHAAEPAHVAQRDVEHPQRRLADQRVHMGWPARALAAGALDDDHPRLRLDHVRQPGPRRFGVRRRVGTAAVHVRPQHPGDARDVLAASAPERAEQPVPGLHRRRLLLPRQPRRGRHLDDDAPHLRDRRDARIATPGFHARTTTTT